MKRIKLIPLLILLMIIGLKNYSCQKDSNNRSGLDGTWYLTEYIPSAEFQVNIRTFEPGQISWTFDTINQKIDIKIDKGVNFNLIKEGSYNYEFGDNGCNYDDNLFIIIDNRGFGTLIKTGIPNDTLVISDACVDGHILNFSR
jgi:hypothetical protein